MDFLLPALVCAVVGGAAGWFVPDVIARVPEPLQDPEDRPGAEADVEADVETGGETQSREPAPAKELYADIARSPHLAVRAAIVSAVVAGLFGGVLGWEWPLVYLVPFVPFGVALAVIDWRTRLLPTWLLAPTYPVLVVLVLLCAAVTGNWHDLGRAGLGWLVMGGFYLLTWLISSRLVGYGDVRLAGLLGLALGFLGWGPLVVGMYAAFLIFGIPPLLLALVTRNRSILKLKMPFGPAMLASAALGVVFGVAIGHWYLRLSGIET
jgi:leader peptidase (prepilin peptidase)/N-methyltransferase